MPEIMRGARIVRIPEGDEGVVVHVEGAIETVVVSLDASQLELIELRLPHVLPI